MFDQLNKDADDKDDNQFDSAIKASTTDVTSFFH